MRYLRPATVLPVLALLALHTASPTAAQSTPPSAARGSLDWPMFGYDVGRSSASPAPTGISAATVGGMVRQQVQVDGVIDASLIYLDSVAVGGTTRDVFFATSQFGRTMAIDANDGKVVWTYVPPDIQNWEGSRQITTSTPVADPDRQSIYAGSPDGTIVKLSVNNGRPLWTTAITNLAQREKIASPLAYFQGHVIAVTGGYIGDANPYQGHVAVLDAASGKLLHVWNSLCSDRTGLIDPASCPASRSAIWGRAGAVIDAQTGDIFVATGNGPWDGRTSWGDATLQLDGTATRMLGNYTPENNEELNSRDADVGSTSPVLLGDGYIAQGGKDNTIRILSTQLMSGTQPHRGGELQVVSTPSGNRLFTAPAVLRANGTTWLFAADGGATAAWTFANGRLQPAWKNANPGTSPVVAGGLLFVYDPTGGGLRVYEPATGRDIATLAAGAGHWNSPIVADGRIALPEGGSRNPAPEGARGIVNIWRMAK